MRHRTYPGGGLIQKERRVTPDRITTGPSWGGWWIDPADGESGPRLRHHGSDPLGRSRLRKPGFLPGFPGPPPGLSVAGAAPPVAQMPPVVPPMSRDEAARDTA